MEWHFWHMCFPCPAAFTWAIGKVTIHGLGSLGSQGCWAPWAPYGAGLLGLWAPESDVLSGLSMVLGSLGCWAPEVTGLPSWLGSLWPLFSRINRLPGLPRLLGSQGCWAPVVRGFLMLLDSRGYWAPEITGLPRLLGSWGYWAPEEYWAPDLIRVPKDHCTMFCCEQWKWKICSFFLIFSDSVALYDVG